MPSDVTEAMRVQTLHVVSVLQFCKPLEGDIFEKMMMFLLLKTMMLMLLVMIMMLYADEDDDGLDGDVYAVDVDKDVDDVDLRMAASWARECGMSAPG